MAVFSKTQSSASNSFHGHRHYTLFIAISVIAVIGAPFVFQGGIALIQLNTDYEIGEKMVYSTQITTSYDWPDSSSDMPPKPVTSSATNTIGVIDFDGECYTVNRTITPTHPLSSDSSTLEKINKNGLSTHLPLFNNSTQKTPNNGNTNNSHIAHLLNKPKVKVGDTFTVPYPSESNFPITGDLNIAFKGYEYIKTPAGTFRVFKVEITAENINSHFEIGDHTPDTISTLDLCYTLYLESGTARLIKSIMNSAVSNQITDNYLNQSYITHITIEQTLEQAIKPE
ncbi:MAG: DUF3108 domain-containing protein [Nitrososphaerota archaeon]|jgi:hypothetical protein|nr:DUF3108 domain-containing protein [Nitrososphaerota archaeon]